jgi:CMP-N-acetylneuraminic acid synthetase
MIDFLSYASVSKELKTKNIIVINSVSMIEKALQHIRSSSYKKVEMLLDNDTA